ncbi:MAG: shikimate dehydrogenase [Acutalibacteraceae bacterium]|nr:shikimate dehydrogenase [Acutalibacteraceae bacterium]
MEKYAVIGYPLGHTMSPFIHNRMFELNGINATYEAILTPPEKLKDTVEMLKKSYNGFNITIPHKEALLSLIDEPTKTAEIYKAVNTVANKNGRLFGYSTDAEGFVAALELEDIPLKGKVLILGGGGVSRTIATECALRGCDVTFAVLPSEIDRAKLLCGDLKERFMKEAICITLEDIKGEYDLAVNGTPVGMYPNTNDSILNENQLKNIKYVFDAVYNPENTKFIGIARSLGIKAVSGMGMLVMQAAKAQEYWYGATFNKQDMKQLIKDAGDEMRRLFIE